MILATNTPAAFIYQKGDHRIVELGEETDTADVIVLMLLKNWGSHSVAKINAITHWVSSYPTATPCIIAGAETTIPDMDVERYRQKERDEAVRALCSEVLKRSQSIGVRGRITFEYLTKVVGCRPDQVDVIFEAKAPDNDERTRAFLSRNGAPKGIDNAVLAFQARPYILHERTVTPHKDILISKPYVTQDGDHARLNADITIDGEVKTLWCETTAVYRQFLLSEQSDAFLCALLPFAMRVGKDLVFEAPISEQFLHNMQEVLIPHLCAHDPRMYHTRIIAAGDAAPLVSGGAVATGMSCGVDSLYTTSLYASSPFRSLNLTHLYCGNYLYGNSGLIYERAEAAAQSLNLPLVRTATNINEVLNLPHLFTHFYKTMFGVLSLRKLFRIYYYSSAEDFSHFNLKGNGVRDTAQIELLLLYAFTTSSLQVITGGAKSERLEKTRAICEFETARKYLNVCLYPALDSNCGKCQKCMRTLLTLDSLGSLERFSEVFDIEAYRANRLNSFAYLVREKDSIMLADVYRHFAVTEPVLVEEAERLVAKVAR